MDFVVVGLGLGALAVLLGLTIRDAGSRWWPIRQDQPLSAAELSRRLAIGRACRGGGLVLSLAGAGISLVTILALLLGLSDRAGATLVMISIAMATIGCLGWGIVYTQRHHPRPIPRAMSRRAQAEEPVPDAPPPLAEAIDAGAQRHGGPPDQEAAAESPLVSEAAADEVPADTGLGPMLGPPLPAALAASNGLASPPDASGSVAPLYGPARPDTIAATDEHDAPASSQLDEDKPKQEETAAPAETNSAPSPESVTADKDRPV